MKTTSAHHRTTIISRNRHKQLILTSNLLKGRKINILHSSCWCQALYKLAFTNLSSVALTSVSHRRFPALSVGSLYYQGAAHMPAGLLLGPAQFSCFAHLVICTWSLYLLRRVVPAAVSHPATEHPESHLDMCSGSQNMNSDVIVQGLINTQDCWSLLNAPQGWKQGKLDF